MPIITMNADDLKAKRSQIYIRRKGGPDQRKPTHADLEQGIRDYISGVNGKIHVFNNAGRCTEVLGKRHLSDIPFCVTNQ